MISVYAIIEINEKKKEWNEIYNYQKKKFALRKIRELYFRQNSFGKIYCLAWHDFVSNTTHCIRVDRKLNLEIDDWNNLIDNNSKGSLPIRKAKSNPHY